MSSYILKPTYLLLTLKASQVILNIFTYWLKIFVVVYTVIAACIFRYAEVVGLREC